MEQPGIRLLETTEKNSGKKTVFLAIIEFLVFIELEQEHMEFSPQDKIDCFHQTKCFFFQRLKIRTTLLSLMNQYVIEI